MTKEQEISQTDAIDEGVMQFGQDWLAANFPLYGELYRGWLLEKDKTSHPLRPPIGPLPAERYAALWDSINAKRGFSWKLNPWVWVITFQKIKVG